MIAIRPMMNMTCSFDHRVLDGAQVGFFLADVRKRLRRGASTPRSADGRDPGAWLTGLRFVLVAAEAPDGRDPGERADRLREDPQRGQEEPGQAERRHRDRPRPDAAHDVDARDRDLTGVTGGASCGSDVQAGARTPAEASAASVPRRVPASPRPEPGARRTGHERTARGRGRLGRAAARRRRG